MEQVILNSHYIKLIYMTKILANPLSIIREIVKQGWKKSPMFQK